MQSATKQTDPHQITSLEQLDEIYGKPSKRSLDKEINYISEHYRQFIEAAPFFALTTATEDGTDCSPRGDPAGFVKVLDEKTIQFPDRKGNNRLDSLRNIVRNPNVSLMFLIPGVGEAIRLNGKATLSVDPDLRAQHAMEGKIPKAVITVTVDTIYFQCQKAIYRSGLWTEEAKVDRSTLPTAGQITQALSSEPFDGDSYDKAYPERMKATAY